MKIVEKIKAFWRARKPRERLMILCCVAIVAMLWFSLLMRKNGDLNSQTEDLQRREDLAQTVMANAGMIANAEALLAKTFDKSKMLSGAKLQPAIDACAQRAGVDYKLSSVAESTSANFKIYSTSISISKTSNISALVEFEAALKKLAPYASVSRAVFSGDGKGACSVKYDILSFEIVEASK